MLILMLIEDNEDDILLTKRAIRKMCPECEIEIAVDGQKGIECIFDPECSEKVSLILLDINLPKINGLDILHRIKTDPDKKDIPTVMLTSSSYEGDQSKAAEYGADMYVIKPLGLKEFETRIAEIIERFIYKKK